MFYQAKYKYVAGVLIVLLATVASVFFFTKVSSVSAAACSYVSNAPKIGPYGTPMASGGIQNCTNGTYRIRVCLKQDIFGIDPTIVCSQYKTVRGTQIDKKSGCQTTGPYGEYFYTETTINGKKYQSDRTFYYISSCNPPRIGYP